MDRKPRELKGQGGTLAYIESEYTATYILKPSTIEYYIELCASGYDAEDIPKLIKWLEKASQWIIRANQKLKVKNDK